MNTPATTIICGVAIEVCFLLFSLQKEWFLHINLYLVLYGFLFLLCLAAWKSQAIPVSAVIGFAVLFRLTLLPTIPSLSDDIFRYGWEGRLPRQGYSPFRYPPEAPELSHLRNASWERINHKTISTVYPTFSQFAFRAGTYITDFIRFASPTGFKGEDRWWIWTDVMGQKIVFVFFDLLTMLVVWKLMAQYGVDSRNLLLYAWNPLVIIEIAGSGHHDSLGICMLTLGVLAWEKGHPLWAGAGLAASFLSKYMSALLVPAAILRADWPLLGAWGLLAAAGLALVRPPTILVTGPTRYTQNWQFNASFYALLQPIIGGNGYLAKSITAVLGFGAMWWVARVTVSGGPALTAFWSIAIALFFAPTVHPWYFLWLTPFLCLFPNPAFLLWNGTIALSYTVLTRYRTLQVWDLNPAIQIVEYLPVYVWLVFQKI